MKRFLCLLLLIVFPVCAYALEPAEMFCVYAAECGLDIEASDFAVSDNGDDCICLLPSGVQIGYARGNLAKYWFVRRGDESNALDFIAACLSAGFTMMDDTPDDISSLASSLCVDLVLNRDGERDNAIMVFNNTYGKLTKQDDGWQFILMARDAK